MNVEEREALVAAVGQVIADEVSRGLEPVKQELLRLTVKLEAAELKARELRYAGVWHAQSRYRKGNFCTHNGSLWHCDIDDVLTMPGTDPVAWTLAVKSMARA